MTETAELQVAAKVAKAIEFFKAAEMYASTSFDASVSLSTSAAINAADALLLFNTGNYPSGSDHGRAVTLLRKFVNTSASTQLARVLGLKSKAQYSTKRCSLSEAESALKNAERLVQRCDVLK